MRRFKWGEEEIRYFNKKIPVVKRETWLTNLINKYYCNPCTCKIYVNYLEEIKKNEQWFSETFSKRERDRYRRS